MERKTFRLGSGRCRTRKFCVVVSLFKLLQQIRIGQRSLEEMDNEAHARHHPWQTTGAGRPSRINHSRRIALQTNGKIWGSCGSKLRNCTQSWERCVATLYAWLVQEAIGAKRTPLGESDPQRIDSSETM